MAATVRQLLQEKGNPPAVAVTPGATVRDALQLMAEKEIGAVAVMQDCHLLGIFSERDYARRLVLKGRNSADTLVTEVMTDKVIYVGLGQTAAQCMAIMTEKRIRHLPVIDEGCVIGIVSIGDAVRHTIEEQRITIDSLVRYITA